jgi:hypothetical protein
MAGAYTARQVKLDRSLIVINPWLPVSKNIVLRDNYGKTEPLWPLFPFRLKQLFKAPCAD